MPQLIILPGGLRPGDRIVQPDGDEAEWPEVAEVGAVVGGETQIMLTGEDTPPMLWPSGLGLSVLRADDAPA